MRRSSQVAVPGPFRAFQGDEPYVFVGYAHRDVPVAHAALAELDRYGYRIWYDEGITPSRDWADVIATRIRHCAAFVVLLSENAVVSEDVKNEISFALAERKQFLASFLGDTALPDGMRLQLSRKQAIFRHQMEPADYEAKIRESLPAQALRPATAKGPAQDVVSVTVFAPTRVKHDGTWLVQAWPRAAGAAGDLAALASEIDPDNELQSIAIDGLALIRGTRIGFELSLEGSSSSCRRERTWNGWADMAALRIEAAGLALDRLHEARLAVLLDGLEVTRITLSLEVGDTAVHAPAAVGIRQQQAVQRVFLCYAAKDRETVAHYAALLRAGGADVFMDVTSVGPGEHWEERITQEIAESDVFMLFWSRAAAESAWVEREWRLALSLGHEPFIRPVLLDMAPIPAELMHLHFRRLTPGP